MGLHSNPFAKSSLSYFYTIGYIIGQNRAAAHNKIKTKNPPSKFVPNSWIWDGDTPLERPGLCLSQDSVLRDVYELT